MDEDEIRSAAFAWLDRVTLGGSQPVTRDELANDFVIDGRRFPLVDRGRGIRKPAGWSAALSIMTSFPKRGMPAYDDREGRDGLHRYKLRRDSGGSAENAALRAALKDGTPLIWFVGVEPGVFNAVCPVYLIAEERDEDQFVMALSDEQREVRPGSAVELSFKRYLMRQTKQRLHQPLFASRIMLAYDTHCAVCDLGHRPLLDAAHIIADRDGDGDPVVPNGLALCKIHHAAYDANILGIRPDLVIEIRSDLLEEIDGPMLRHGLQQHHAQRLMRLPARRTDRPDATRLEHRYAQFRSA